MDRFFFNLENFKEPISDQSDRHREEFFSESMLLDVTENQRLPQIHQEQHVRATR